MESRTSGLSQQTTTSAVLQIAAGFGISQALFVAAKVGVADLLSCGPKSVQDVARDACLQSEALYRLMRALASVGVFAEEQHGVFRNTPLSETFLSSASGSLRPFLIMSREPESWRSWGDLLHSVQTGQPAFEHMYGKPFFEYLAAHAEPARIFDEAMDSRSAAEIAAVLSVYDFSTVKQIVDVGGGNGALIKEVLSKFPNTYGVLYDLPHVIERAEFSIAEQLTRLRLQSGDFFSRIPEGGDLYIMKKIIHDWPDDRAMQILRCCRKAMAPGSCLLLVELVVPPGDGATFTKFIDLWMLVWLGGRERTEKEYRDLLASAGLALTRVIPTHSPISIIEANLA
jgi:hypothetical protein